MSYGLKRKINILFLKENFITTVIKFFFIWYSDIIDKAIRIHNTRVEQTQIINTMKY